MHAGQIDFLITAGLGSAVMAGTSALAGHSIVPAGIRLGTSAVAARCAQSGDVALGGRATTRGRGHTGIVSGRAEASGESRK